MLCCQMREVIRRGAKRVFRGLRMAMKSGRSAFIAKDGRKQITLVARQVSSSLTITVFALIRSL